MNEEKFNKWFNIFLLVGMTLTMIVSTWLSIARDSSDIIWVLVAAFGALMGVFCTVCTANAKILTYLFGFISVSIYGVMCLKSHNYGNAAVNLLYFLPMQFVGFWQWRRRGAMSESGFKARRLTPKQRLMWGAIFLVLFVVVYIVLIKLGQREAASAVRIAIFMDAFSMACNIIGQVLMSLAYMEQYVFWIGVNVTSVVMWIATAAAGTGSEYSYIYVIKYFFYLICAFNGLRIWLKISRA